MGKRKWFADVIVCAERIYTNLGWIFIVMSVVWFYFTLNETLVVTTEQETLEFPLMASKLFDQFSPAFLGMNALMIAATWMLVAPKFVSEKPSRNPLMKTPLGVGVGIAFLVIFFLLWLQPAALANPTLQTILILACVALLFLSLFGVTQWLKPRLIPASVIASSFVSSACGWNAGTSSCPR